jgi:hypothetical protein
MPQPPQILAPVKLSRVISDHPETNQPLYDDVRVSPPTRPPSPRPSPTLNEHEHEADLDGSSYSLRRKKEQQSGEVEKGGRKRGGQPQKPDEVEDPETREWENDEVL